MFTESVTRLASIGDYAERDPWLARELIEIHFRLLLNGWIDPPQMTVQQAEGYGRTLGHWGLVALAVRDVQAGVMYGAFGGGR